MAYASRNHLNSTQELALPDTKNVQSAATIELAADIISAYVTRNRVSVADLPGLLKTVHASLTTLASGSATAAEPESEKPTAAEPEFEKPTAAQIRKSITPDGLVSFIDGKSYKTLKRHLMGHGLHPASYKARYGLPHDYPMVAAAYAARRSELAKGIGLGRGGERPAPKQPKAAEPEQPKARGRRKAA